jgi:hypothetical protein
MVLLLWFLTLETYCQMRRIPAMGCKPTVGYGKLFSKTAPAARSQRVAGFHRRGLLRGRWTLTQSPNRPARRTTYLQQQVEQDYVSGYWQILAGWCEILTA